MDSIALQKWVARLAYFASDINLVQLLLCRTIEGRGVPTIGKVLSRTQSRVPYIWLRIRQAWVQKREFLRRDMETLLPI